MANSLNLIFKKVVDTTAERLSQYGFKKNGNTFRLISGDNVAIIGFQKSSGNTVEKLSFTVNLAIVCGLLLDPSEITIQKARAIDGHLRERIGTLLPDRADKWWDIDDTTVEEAVSMEVAGIIDDVAIAYLRPYLDTSKLVELWESGQSPGLTDGARIRNLESLKAVIAKGQ